MFIYQLTISFGKIWLQDKLCCDNMTIFPKNHINNTFNEINVTVFFKPYLGVRVHNFKYLQQRY